MRELNQHDNKNDSNVIDCPDCFGTHVHTRVTFHRFTYGVGDAAVQLICDLPVRICEDCHSEFVDEEGENVRHDAVCDHLGVLKPSEIQALRDEEGTQSQFAALTGIGEASLSRWETGASIQSKAYDNFLYLLRYPDNLSRLHERRRGFPSEGKFRCIEVTKQKRIQQSRFSLRRVA